MKDMKYYFRFIALMICVLLVACNDDDKETKPVFPELQKIECAVGNEETLTFDAVGNWTLVSSALWCTFIVDGEEVFTCSGTAGKHSVTIRISDDATELMKSYKAELTLMMGGAKQIICEVTRPATGYELHVFNGDQTVEYTAENPFGKTYDQTEYLTVSSNADWVVESSEGLELEGPVSGSAGDNVALELTLKSGFTKNAWQGSLIFKNKNNETIGNIPVSYDGIPADRIEFSTTNPFTAIPFSHDGWTYTLNSEKHDAPMPVSVVAKDDKYTHIYVEYSEDFNDEGEYEYTFIRMSEDESWFFIDDDKAGNIALNAIPNRGMERKGYLLVFPKEKYDAIKDNFDEIVLLPGGIADDCIENIAVNIKQEGNPKFTTGFVITDGEGSPLLDDWGQPIEAMPYAQAGGELTPEELEAKYGTSNVAILSLPLLIDYSMIIGKPNGFTGLYLEATADFNGETTAWDGVEVGFWDMKEFSLMGLAPGVTGEKDMVISCLDNGNVHAVLLVSRYPVSNRKNKK